MAWHEDNEQMILRSQRRLRCVATPAVRVLGYEKRLRSFGNLESSALWTVKVLTVARIDKAVLRSGTAEWAVLLVVSRHPIGSCEL